MSLFKDHGEYGFISYKDLAERPQECGRNRCRSLAVAWVSVVVRFRRNGKPFSYPLTCHVCGRHLKTWLRGHPSADLKEAAE